MRAYIQIVFSLLLPLGGLFMILATLYYRQNNDFSEALKLGVLTGFLLTSVITPIIAFFLYIMRNIKKLKLNKTIQKEKSITKRKTEKKPKKNSHNTSKDKTEKKSFINEQKIILLMDKNLSLNVILYAITEQNIGTVTQEKDNEKIFISIQTKTELIKFIITSLTKHTTEVTIISPLKCEDTKKIITYLKEKEYSFLDY